MSKPIQTGVDERLLDARRQSLKEANSTSIRPHGKLWGMDVFSWFNADVDLISNTLHAFPFPVIWVGNKADIMEAVNTDESLFSNLHGIIIYDGSVFEMGNDLLSRFTNCVGTNSIEEAFGMIHLLKAPQKVLLFTSNDQYWEENKFKFEQFLKLVKV